MVDPTSSLNEDVDEADAPDCETCGATVVMESTHRVITWIDDGSVQSAHFCDDRCRMNWDGEST